jgi:DNA-binding NtrC family response regulator
MIAATQFRSDLYFRLRVFEIHLPPLRERKGDLPLLAAQLLERIRARLNRPHISLSKEAEAALAAHQWPGNVRELENALERAVILCEGALLTPDLLALAPRAPRPTPPSTSLEDYFVRFVREHEGEMGETELAEALGISRKALWEKRQRLDLQRKR